MLRMNFTVVLIGLIVFSSPAFAGTLSVVSGQTQWQSTQCSEPVAPPSLMGADSETHANSMNAMMSQYNQYSQAMQAYMDCVGNEAQNDSIATVDSITHSAQATIDDAKSKVAATASTLNQPAPPPAEKPRIKIVPQQ